MSSIGEMHALASGLQLDLKIFRSNMAEEKDLDLVGEALRFWSEGSGQGVQAELTIQIAASAGMKLIKTGNGAHDPT